MSTSDHGAQRAIGGADGLSLKRDKQEARSERPWKLLIVDDEPEVHSVTRLALSDFRFNGRELAFMSAYSGAEAREILQEDPEIAVMLLDVVMESDDAGLQVVQFVRQTLGNHFLRIILRTGHPGLAPERRVIQAYDINDYRAKTELTQDRMFSLMHTSLAAYERLNSLAHSRRFLRTVADEYQAVLERITARLDAPVQALLTASECIRQSAILKQDQRAETALGEIEQQCRELQRTTSALQHLGGLVTGDEMQQLFDVNAAVDEALARMDELCTTRGAQLSVGELPRVCGYRKLFVDLFEHLLRNAIQFQSGASPTVEVTARARGKDWQFAVADRGSGVPPDQAEEIFQTFSQVVHTEHGGLGIGLAVCRKIVALHGGKLWTEQRPGGGAVFLFTISADGAVHDDG